MNATELAQHVIDNWEALTGTPLSEMDEEGHFPQVVEDLCAKEGVDLDAFSDAFNDLSEGDEVDDAEETEWDEEEDDEDE